MTDATNSNITAGPQLEFDLGQPGLRLVLGPANSGKMGHVLNWWRDRLHLNPVVVVPNAPDAHELTLEMLRRVGSLVGASAALTFDGLVAQVLGVQPRYVSDFERNLSLKRILRETPFQALGPLAGLPGTLAAVGSLLARFEESGRTQQAIEEILAGWGGTDSDQAGLAADILQISRLYAQWRQDCGRTERAAEVRRACSSAPLWTRPVALYGFNSFTPGQAMFIQSLAASVPVVLTLPHDKSRQVNLAPASEIERWQAVAKEVVELAGQVQAYSSPAIAYLENNFMHDRADPKGFPASDLEGVRFMLSSGRRNEAESVAHQIAGLIRAGVAPGQIAVVVRRVDTWRGLLCQVFDSCHIPYRVDSGRRFVETGFGRALMSAVHARIDDDADALLAYLRSPYSGLSAEVVSDAETRYRRGFLRGARHLWTVVDVESRKSLATLGRAVEVAEDGPSPGRLDLALFEQLGARMLRAGLQGLAPGSRQAEEDIRAHQALGGALGSLREISRDGQAPEWLEPRLVVSILADLSVPSGQAEGQEAVQLLSVHRLRARRFHALFILGLVEGEFPSGGGKPSLLTERQRLRINSLGGGEILPGDSEDEAPLFVNAVARAWQVLYLSSRDADDGGAETAPSHFWQLSERLLRADEGCQVRRTLADQVFPAATAPTERHYRRSVAPRAQGRLATIADATHYQPSWTRTIPALSNPQVLAGLQSRASFSASEIEKYLDCPFAWFLQYCANVTEIDTEFDGRTYGQLAHDVLSQTYRQLARENKLPLTPERVKEATTLAHQRIDQLMGDDICPGSASQKRIAAWGLKKATEALFQKESLEASHLIPIETEQWVGGWDGVDIGGIRIRGRVDRVDSDRDGNVLFVVDYKTGSVPSRNRIGTAKGLQLPLYLAALSVERPKARVIGGCYLSLVNGERSGVVMQEDEDLLGAAAEGCRVLDEEQQQELREATLELARSAAGSITAGMIAPLPERKCPSWCEFGTACRARRGGYRP